eukprot:CAMPEP_0119105614 /NCGR_PEP_ID=MMETSP1180-20130426/3528_1 /TAXON_ID=3052 ORGANISM="Chlamydomonas cf sp, Strain CCMP681" /NCGR_SAMPLE_ID=MMETSP1180 /ASSEMBLY_ACC=CAM_ASM_000741 /LENGTH=262 /DNA_ID=CAMNT_0007090709 /DNA_START=32 /DNA_END=820 /DNA_ORIENTATION=-
MKSRAAGGREPTQLRTLALELSSLARADGSARWTQDSNGTSVIAAVYGPRQAAQRKENAEQAVIEIVMKPRSGMAGSREREYEAIIRQTLEGVVLTAQHPRTSIMVVLQVAADRGSLLSCALNAACAALVDAGVPMRRMLASVSCVMRNDGPGLLLDPDDAEQLAARQLVVMTFAHQYKPDSQPEQQQGDGSTTQPCNGKVIATLDEGALACHTVAGQAGLGGSTVFSADELLDAFDICRQGCQQVANFMHSAALRLLQPVA